MFKFMQAFSKSMEVIRRDKVVLILGMVPVIVGIVIYYFLGSWIYGDLLNIVKTWIGGYIASDTWGSVASVILGALFTVVLYFIISWTFVMVVSLISSPFNDIMSSRVEKYIDGKTPDSVDESFKRMLGRFFKIIFNEVKKIGFIIVLSTFGFLLSFIPFLVPISFLISAVLLAVSFVDYSWSRHELSFGDCIGNLKSNFLSYSLGGSLMLAIVSLPVVNLVALPFAVVYFTVLYASND